MIMAKFLFYFIVLSLLLRNSNTCNPEVFVSTFVGVGAIGCYWSIIHCLVFECCTDNWISYNPKQLYYQLNHRIYGQHLVTNITFKQVTGHLTNESPKKALALSSNGMTGVGKNYASRIIAESIYRKGFESQYVKLIIGSHDFKHSNELERDKVKLKKWITETVSKCPRSLFIFDEVEKIRPELVDVLKPFLSHYPQVDGVDYRKAIFIFIGNTGADLINKEVIRSLKQGKRREDITIKQMDKILSKGALKKVGGFLHSTLLEHQLVEYFIPFLPLERHHVIKCIEDDLKEKKVLGSASIVQKVLNELLYFPDEGQWFSKSGCKKVSSKVDQYIHY